MPTNRLGSVRKSHRVREVTFVILGAVFVSVLTTWPIVRSIDAVAHDPHDPLFEAWSIDWTQHALGSDARVEDANIFAPNSETHAYSDPLIGLALGLLPLRWAGMTPIGVQNGALLVAYIASAVAGYAFGRGITGRPLIGVCTGVVYAFGPYNTFLAQHVNIMFHPGPALAALIVWRMADNAVKEIGEGRNRLIAVLSLVVAIQGTVSFYTGALTIVAAAAMAVARLPALAWRGLARVGTGLAIGVVALLPIAWPYLVVAREIDGYRWSLADLGVSSASFLQVDPSLRIWGSSLGSPLGLFAQPTFPGLTIVVLAGAGLWLWASRRPHMPMWTASVVLAVTGAVLAIGASNQGWRRYTPYRLAFDHVPVVSALRAPGRFFIVCLLGLGVLVGFAAQSIADRVAIARSTRLRNMVAVGLGFAVCIGVVAEGSSSWESRVSVHPSPVDEELAEIATPGGVVYLPMSRPKDGLGVLGQSVIVYRTTAHHRRTPNGYGGFVPPSYDHTAQVLRALPQPEALSYLKSIGVRYVVVASDAGPWADLRDPGRAYPLRFHGQYGDDILYEVP